VTLKKYFLGNVKRGIKGDFGIKSLSVSPSAGSGQALYERETIRY
jgi:hypothetical protein